MHNKTGTANTKTQERAVIYGRASTVHQPDSVDDQLLVGEMWCKDKNYQVTAKIGEVKTGRSFLKRHGIVKIIQLAATKPRSFEVLVVGDISRLGRRLGPLHSFFETLTHYGVRIESPGLGKIEEIHITALALVAKLQLDVSTAQIRRAHIANIVEGLRAGGAPTGYRPVQIIKENGEIEKGHLEINDSEAEIVKRIFRLRSEGYSCHAIAKILNADGVKPPRRGKYWKARTVQRIIDNPTYKALNVYGKTRQLLHPSTEKRVVEFRSPEDWVSAPGKYEPIIEPDLYDHVKRLEDEVRAKRKSNKNLSQEDRGPKRLLSGKWKCPECGGGFTIVGGGRDGRKRVGCRSRYIDQFCSHSRTYYADVVESVVVSGMRDLLRSPDAIEAYLTKYNSEVLNGYVRGPDLDGLNTEIAEINRELEKLAGYLKAGVSSRVIIVNQGPLLERLGEIEKLRAEETARVANNPPPVTFELAKASLSSYLATIETLGSRLSTLPFAPEDEALAVHFRQLIDRVIVHPNPDGCGFVAEVHGHLASLVKGSNGDPVVMSSAELSQGLGLYQMEKTQELIQYADNRDALKCQLFTRKHGQDKGLPIQESDIDEVARLIRKTGYPMKPRELIESLTQVGISLTCHNPTASLRAALRRRIGVFIYLRGHGFWLRELPYVKASYVPAENNCEGKIIPKGLVNWSSHEKVANGIEQILLKANAPFRTADLVKALTDLGLITNQTDPAAVVRNVLAKNRNRFISFRRKGYWLRNVRCEIIGYDPKDVAAIQAGYQLKNIDWSSKILPAVDDILLEGGHISENSCMPYRDIFSALVAKAVLANRTDGAESVRKGLGRFPRRYGFVPRKGYWLKLVEE